MAISITFYLLKFMYNKQNTNSIFKSFSLSPKYDKNIKNNLNCLSTVSDVFRYVHDIPFEL